MAKRRRIGFSLVEMLVVISIIGVLVAISTGAYLSISRHSKTTATRATLAMARAMIAEAAAGDPSLTKTLGGVAGTLGAPVGTGTALAEQTTSGILKKLLTLPANRAAYARISPDNLRSRDASNGVLDPPIFSDAFDRPILFVPGGGLTGVNIAGGGRGSITVKAPDGLPFWASGGADRDFSKGDDNIYSFEN